MTNSTQAGYDYDCKISPASAIAKYNASPVYQIIGLSSDYKTSDTATSLNTSSNLVRALQGGPIGCQHAWLGQASEHVRAHGSPDEGGDGPGVALESGREALTLPISA